MNKPFLSIGWADAGKGLLIAVATPIAANLIGVLNAFINAGGQGSINFNWKLDLAMGTSAGLVYLVKQFFTNSSNELGKSEAK